MITACIAIYCDDLTTQGETGFRLRLLYRLFAGQQTQSDSGIDHYQQNFHIFMIYLTKVEKNYFAILKICRLILCSLTNI